MIIPIFISNNFILIMKLFKLFSLICCCFLYSNSYAQSPKEIEADLLKSFKKISYWSEQRSKDTSLNWINNLEEANEVFGNKLKYYTGKYPSTINCPFNSLKKEHLDIIMSADGLFRIYSWDTWQGGTMHDFENVLQYKSGGKVTSILDTTKSDEDYVYYYSNLYTMKAKGKTYYLAVYRGIFSTKDVSEGVRIFTIENGKLNDAKLIKTPAGLHHKIEYGFDFFSEVDWKVRPAIHFDKAKKTLYIPLVDETGKMTHQFILYKFNGKYFEKIKTSLNDVYLKV
ncbi:MAG: hypothetical protein JWR54_2267 [Mucilaginibacter sp.]|nr:hypothetical protein [Mucilaginibacter sp.]